MAKTSKSGDGQIPDPPTPDDARDYLSRQPSHLGFPDGPIREVFDRFIIDRTKRRGPANFEEN